MKFTSIRAALLLLACLALPASAGPEEPKRDLLGLHLAMTQEESEKRLQEIGTLERHERKQQEIWRVRDASYSHILIGRDKAGALRFITATARTDAEAQRVPYAAIGNLERAKQTGGPAIKNFRYEWELPKGERSPVMLVRAMGRDENHLSTLTLKRISSDDGE